MPDYTSDRDFRSRKPAMVMFACAVAAFGSFLWLKMRLVSNMPRTAYAEPEQAGRNQGDLSQTPEHLTTDPAAHTDAQRP